MRVRAAPPLAAPSWEFSVFSICVGAAKGAALLYRWWKGKQVVKEDTALTSILSLLDILLFVLSLPPVKIAHQDLARQILLSLANGALILYQYRCTLAFRAGRYHKSELIITILLIIGLSVLSPVLPYVLEKFEGVSILSPVVPDILKKYEMPCYLTGLIFFALIYLLLFIFYFQLLRRGLYTDERIHDILTANVFLSIIACLSVLPSIVPYLVGVIDYEFSLWIKYTFCELWLFQWSLWQCVPGFRWRRSTDWESFATNTYVARDAGSRSFPTNTTSTVSVPLPVHRHERSHPSEFNPIAYSRILFMDLYLPSPSSRHRE